MGRIETRLVIAETGVSLFTVSDSFAKKVRRKYSNFLDSGPRAGAIKLYLRHQKTPGRSLDIQVSGGPRRYFKHYPGP